MANHHRCELCVQMLKHYFKSRAPFAPTILCKFQQVSVSLTFRTICVINPSVTSVSLTKVKHTYVRLWCLNIIKWTSGPPMLNLTMSSISSLKHGYICFAEQLYKMCFIQRSTYQNIIDRTLDELHILLSFSTVGVVVLMFDWE